MQVVDLFLPAPYLHIFGYHHFPEICITIVSSISIINARFTYAARELLLLAIYNAFLGLDHGR
jgi:hypothetical protein